MRSLLRWGGGTAVLDEPATEVVETQVAEPQVVDRDRVIADIQVVGDCSRQVAAGFLAMLDKAATDLGGQAGALFHIGQRDLDRYHTVMDRVIPDDAVAAPGSLHAHINALTLGGNGLDRQWVHTWAHRGETRYCFVEVAIAEPVTAG